MIRRIATSKAGTGKPAIIIELTNNERAEVSHAALVTLDTAAKIKAEVESQAKQSLPDIHIHINVDGSIAGCDGDEPDAWPEDEK